MSKTVVLMSTHNGAKFVVEQLHSILRQLPADGRIIVRDDGSSDGTSSLVESIGDQRVKLIRGFNVGFSKSFLTLLANAPPDANMVMISDQDDVWLPGKIERAWFYLRAEGEMPALYGSAQMLVDAELRPLRATAPWQRPPSFQGALTENIITGCTAALNAPAVRLLQRAGVADGIYFHDWWFYLVVSAFGRVVFDPEPTMLYRQHDGNQIGLGAGWLGRRLHMARFLLRHDWVGILLSHVCTLLSVYGPDLSASQRRLVLGHFEVDADLVLPRWRLIFSLRRWRERVLEEPALRMMLAAYRLQIWPARSRRLKINATAGFPTAARQTRVDPPPCHSPQTSSKAQTRK